MNFYFLISVLWYCSAILRFSENDSVWIIWFSLGTLNLGKGIEKGILEKKRKNNANEVQNKDKKE